VGTTNRVKIARLAFFRVWPVPQRLHARLASLVHISTVIHLLVCWLAPLIHSSILLLRVVCCVPRLVRHAAALPIAYLAQIICIYLLAVVWPHAPRITTQIPLKYAPNAPVYAKLAHQNITASVV
jgi:hypothetical protein